jgi:hypothetical protein
VSHAFDQLARRDPSVIFIMMSEFEFSVHTDLIPRECFADLAGNPLGRGICGDGDPDEAPAGQSNKDKTIEQIKADGRCNEQIHGRDIRRVVAQEGAPLVPCRLAMYLATLD